MENDGKIDFIGLTQLFKLSYNKTLYDAICQDRDDKKPDLAETMFGSEKSGLAIKGRVVFGHLQSNIVRFESSKTVEQVLGSPNPTYYPDYIRQADIINGKANKYKTLMDKNAQISGWKRYLLQNGIQSYQLPTDDNGKVNHDVATKFRPLDSGTEFTGKIVFHNLNKAEIAALLSSLSFHGQNDKCLHNLGMAKSLGYGKIHKQECSEKMQAKESAQIQQPKTATGLADFFKNK
jgi:CRISPR-associated protein (TIGR03986 family)